MSILYILIPLGMVLLGIAIWAFMWAVRSGQFEDMDGPAYRILMDDDDPRIPGNKDLGNNSDEDKPGAETEDDKTSDSDLPDSDK